jgi:hypothetical protein
MSVFGIKTSLQGSLLKELRNENKLSPLCYTFNYKMVRSENDEVVLRFSI